MSELNFAWEALSEEEGSLSDFLNEYRKAATWDAEIQNLGAGCLRNGRNSDILGPSIAADAMARVGFVAGDTHLFSGDFDVHCYDAEATSAVIDETEAPFKAEVLLQRQEFETKLADEGVDSTEIQRRSLDLWHDTYSKDRQVRVRKQLVDTQVNIRLSADGTLIRSDSTEPRWAVGVLKICGQRYREDPVLPYFFGARYPGTRHGIGTIAIEASKKLQTAAQAAYRAEYTAYDRSKVLLPRMLGLVASYIDLDLRRPEEINSTSLLLSVGPVAPYGIAVRIEGQIVEFKKVNAGSRVEGGAYGA